MFGLFSTFLRSNTIITTPVIRNLNMIAVKNTKSSLLSANTPMIEQVAHRSNRMYVPDWNIPYKHCGMRAKNYKANIFKRMTTHGLETRLQTRGGKQILWRKILKGQSGHINFVVAP